MIVRPKAVPTPPALSIVTRRVRVFMPQSATQNVRLTGMWRMPVELVFTSLLLLAVSPSLLVRYSIHLSDFCVFFLLRIPLSGLKNENPYQHQGKDRVACRQDPETILPADDVVRRAVDLLLNLSMLVSTFGHDSQALDDVGNVHRDPTHVENKRCSIKQHVRFRRLVQLHDEAKETCPYHDVQDSGHYRRRRMDELEMILK